MSLTQGFRRLLRRAGYDMGRFVPAQNPLARRRKLFETYAIDTVLDVGANTGVYGLELRREIGFRGRIISFEPMREVFQTLARTAQADGHWEAHNCALGEKDGNATIHVADNSWSSSLLGMLPAQTQAAPDSRYVADETITVKTLDGLFDVLCPNPRSVYLKLDTQGYEAQVLNGAAQSLKHIGTVQIELSLVPLYEGTPGALEMMARLSAEGYRLVSVEPGFSNLRTGEMLQLHGIFRRG